MFFSEKALIKRAVNGNPNAWESLVKKHEKQVFNTALRLTSNYDDALDLTQEVFFDVYRKLSQFRFESAFSTWLHRITFGKSIDYIRRHKREDLLDENSLIENENPHTQLIKNERNRQILKFFQKLTEEQRLIIEMKFYQGMTFSEIGSYLDMSPNTVKTRFYAALRNHKLKQEAIHVM